MENISFEINHMNIIAKWKYSCKNDECICSRNLQAPTKQEIVKKKITNDIIIGKCGHGFHKACITEFVKSYNVCPIDKLPFEQQHDTSMSNKSVYYNCN
jgi:RING-box protein 1